MSETVPVSLLASVLIGVSLYLSDCLLIFSNARPVKATKTFQFKLFPGADHLVNLSQNEYQGQPEASQETHFKNEVDKWNQTVKAQHQAKKDDQTTDDEEDKLQDNIDQELESRHKKMLG